MAEVTYYFDDYDVSEVWLFFPESLVNGLLLSFASGYNGESEYLNSNTSDGTDLGSIAKVELRVYGRRIAYQGTTTLHLQPVFIGGDGDSHLTDIPAHPADYAWSSWINITTDPNAPNPWTWAAVESLGCDAIISATGADAVAASKVEIRVTYLPSQSPDKRSYNGIILGVAVRKQIGKEIIFRVRRGNGFFNSKEGVSYQDRYDYVVPSSINNPEAEPGRANMRAAVDYWKNILTADQQGVYNKRALKFKELSGYSLFIKEALNGEVSMYVDRGDPASVDFGIGDFEIDGAWHTLDLSAYIALTARAVLLDLDFDNTSANRHITIRKKGNVNNYNHFDVATKVAAQEEHAQAIVTPNSSREIEYKISGAGWTDLNFTVRGWWT